MWHTPANLTDDIHMLMESIDENNVYWIQKGWVLDDDDELVEDVIKVGLWNLTEGNKNPLFEYNKAFQNLQARQRMKPVSKVEVWNPWMIGEGNVSLVYQNSGCRSYEVTLKVGCRWKALVLV